MFRTCIEIKQNGVQCGSPALRNNVRCHFHARDARKRYLKHLRLPDITDFAGRKFAINEICQGVIHGLIDPRDAHILLQAVRLSMQAESNQDLASKSRKVMRLAGLHGLNR